MFLKSRENGDLVEILDVDGLLDPHCGVIEGRYHAGEEMQDAANFDKDSLVFPSGESLPRCWTDVNYRG
jgi:hypothetical protein